MTKETKGKLRVLLAWHHFAISSNMKQQEKIVEETIKGVDKLFKTGDI